MLDQDILIDLSRMLELPKCAVLCETPEEAELLLSVVKNQYPNLSRSWSIEDPRWESHGKDTCYTMFFPDDSSPSRLTCGLKIANKKQMVTIKTGKWFRRNVRHFHLECFISDKIKARDIAI